MKLYVTPPSPRAFKVVAVMHHLALDAELAFVDLLHGDHMKPEFAALNPNRKMPVLEDDGFLLWESNAIMQYLASKRPEAGLWPAEPQASGGRQPLAVLGAGALGAGVRHAGVRALRQGTLRPGRPGPGRGRARGARLPPGGAGARPPPARTRLAGGSRAHAGRRVGRGVAHGRAVRALPHGRVQGDRALVPWPGGPSRLAEGDGAAARIAPPGPRGEFLATRTGSGQDAPSMSGPSRDRKRRSVLQELLPRVQDPAVTRREEALVREMLETSLKLLRDSTSVGDLKILNTALRELRYAFKVFAPYRGVRKVSVFGSARTPRATRRTVRAAEFSREIASPRLHGHDRRRARHHARLPGGRRPRAQLRRQHPPAVRAGRRTSSSTTTRSSSPSTTSSRAS